MIKPAARFFSLFVFLISSAVSAQDYSFVSIKGLIEQDVGRIVLPKIYERVGLDIEITPMPGQRAQEEATSGRMDGEIMRIWTYGEENRTTTRVPTPYYYLETMGFILNNRTDIVVNSKEDLAKYKLVKVRGVKHTNNITEGMPFVHDIHDTDHMMEFLNRGRADIALTNTVDGLLSIQKQGLGNIVRIGEPFVVLDLYNYIHADHLELIPVIDQAIQEMMASGELEQIIAEAEQEVIQRAQQ